MRPSYAYPAGVPVALLGLLSDLLIPITGQPGRQRSPHRLGPHANRVRLQPLPNNREIFTIHALCSWFVSSAVFTVLAVVQTVRMLHAGRPVRSRRLRSRSGMLGADGGLSLSGPARSASLPGHREQPRPGRKTITWPRLSEMSRRDRGL